MILLCLLISTLGYAQEGSSPNLVYEASLPLEYAAPMGTLMFHGNSLYLSRKTLSGPRLTQYSLGETGIQEVANPFKYSLSVLGLLPSSEIIGSASNGLRTGIATGSGYYFGSLHDVSEIHQIATDSRGYVYVWGQHGPDGKIQVVKAGRAEWEPVLLREQLLPGPRRGVGAISVNERWLVVNDSWYTKKLRIYDVSDPYLPRLHREISIPFEDAKRKSLIFARPVLRGNSMLIPLGKGVQSYDLGSGNELETLELGEPVMGRAAWDFDGVESLLVGGTNAVAIGGTTSVYELSWPLSGPLKLMGRYQVTRRPDAKGVAALHRYSNRTYIVWMNHLYGESSRNDAGTGTLSVISGFH